MKLNKKNIRLAALLVVSTAFLMACKKNPNCDNARVCVKNVGNDVIWYGWNTNAYADSLAPGEETCNYVGEISDGSYYITRFESDHGTYAIKVEECDQKQEIK